MERQFACAKCLKVWGHEIERYLKEIDDLKREVASRDVIIAEQAATIQAATIMKGRLAVQVD